MKVTLSNLNIKGVELLDPNPLPMFRERNPDGYSNCDDTLTEEEKSLLNYETNFRVLPYCMQDKYTRNKKPMNLKVAILENDKMKATFLCAYGAKLHSLIKKSTGKELLFSNTVIQPGNLAIRNAWTSGGIEWNIGQLGHTFTTCENVFFAKMNDGEEEFLRIFEFERQKSLYWYIDFYLPQGEDLLYAYVRMVNPHDEMTPMYWWTNTAVPESFKTRLFSNTSRCLVMRKGEWTVSHLPNHPALPGVDISYSKGPTFSNEFFFQTPKGTTMPWEAVINEDNTMFIEASTDLLRYRKLFCWGSHQGGVHWQEYLSEPNKGYYVEVQAGLAPTQRHGIKMPANTVWDFVQAFGETKAPEGSHDIDWNKAKDKVEEEVKKNIKEEKLYLMLEKARKLSNKTPEDFLNFGSGWGALEQIRLEKEGKSIPNGFEFPKASIGKEQHQWLNLLENGILTEDEPDTFLPSWMVQKEWLKLLEKSLEKEQNRNWFAYMHLGNMYYENFQEDLAKKAWNKSLDMKPTQWVYRNLASASAQEEEIKEAIEWMDKAYALENKFCDTGFYEEYFDLLDKKGEHAKMWKIFNEMPEEFKVHDRILIHGGKAALGIDNLEYVEKLFDKEYAVIREGEYTMIEMWYMYTAKKVAKEKGIPYTKELLKEVEKTYTPPKTVDYSIY